MIIGITGNMGTGKSTVASILEFEHGFIRLKFSEALKQMVQCLGFTANQLEDPTHKQTPIPELGGVTLRYIMQTLGTEWGRQLIHEDIWCTLLRKRIEEQFPIEDREANRVNFVCDDLRFLNEYEMLKGLGTTFIVWRMKRITGATSTHVSETELSDIIPHTIIGNNSSLGDLEQAVETALRVANLQ